MTENIFANMLSNCLLKRKCFYCQS